MNFGRKIVLVGISILVFLSVLSSVKTNSYILEHKLKNQYMPSEDEVINTTIITDSFKDFLLKDSSFVRLFKDSKVSLSENTFQTNFGKVFVTGSLQSHKKILLNKNTAIDLKDFSVFISKNSDLVSVTAFNKPVPIFIDNFVFLVPKQSSVLLPIDNTTSIKDLSHQDAAKLFFLNHLETFSSEEVSTIDAYKKWKKSFRELVFETPNTWKINQKTGMSKVIRNLQNNVAFFIPKNKRAEWFFSEKMTLLFHGIDFLKKKQYEEAGKIFEFLNKQLKANESLYFFESFPNFEIKWKNYQNAIAILTNLESNSESRALKSLLDVGSTGFSQLENALANNDYSQIERTIENIGVLGNNRAKRIRLFWNIYQNESLHTANAAKLFSSFDTFNLSNVEKIEIKEEIFSLLKQKNSLHTEETEIIDIMTEMLKKINYESFISDEEKEFLFFTKEVKNMGLTKDEIKELKKELALQSELESKILTPISEEGIAPIEEDGAIKNTKMLILFLENQGLEIIKNTIKSNKEDQSTNFSGTIDDQKLSGRFYYNSQYFENILVNESDSYKNIFRNEFSQIIDLIKQSEENDSENIIIDLYKKYQESSAIPQQTTTAILAKNSVAKTLKSYGFLDINIDKIIILNPEYTEAQIYGTTFEKVRQVQISFNTETKTFKNFVGKVNDEIVSSAGNYSFDQLKKIILGIQE